MPGDTHFNLSYLRTDHLPNFHQDEGIQCSVCKLVHVSKRSAALHFNGKHSKKNENNEYLCSLCNLPFKSIDGLKTHVRVDHFNYQPFQCKKCEINFDIQHKLSSHNKRYHPTGEKKYLCDKCEAQFHTSQLLYAHNQKNHLEVPYSCSQCGHTYKSRSGLQTHIKKIHQTQGFFGICDTCGKEFNNKVYFEEHKKRHAIPDIPGAFPCPVENCGKVFGKKNSLRKHAMNVHGQKKPRNLICQFCPKKFKIRSDLVNHEKLMHLNVKDFKCDECDFATITKNKLDVHKRSVHDGVLYYCDYPGCTKSYNLKGNLDAHRLRVHKISRPNAESN